MGPANEKLRKLRLKGSPPHPVFLSPPVPNWPEDIKKILIRNIGHSGTGGERNTGCVGEPFNFNFLSFSFAGPINSYLGYITNSIYMI